MTDDPTPTDTDQKADFETEALPHLDAVYRFALRLSGSPAEAEDLTQDTFLRAHRSWDQYTPGTNCRSWLFTICRNRFLRGRERLKRHDELVETHVARDAGPGREHAVFAAARDVDPEGAFFESVVDEEVLAAIDRLPPEYRTAVVLSDLEGFPYDEIARMEGVPVGTIKSRLFRGRRLLQKELYDYAVTMGYIRPRGADAP